MKPLTIKFRRLLYSGMVMTPTDPGKIGYMILVNSEQSEEQQAITLWHEIIHVLELANDKASGEEAVEALAVKLAKACPEILEICRPAQPPTP